MIERLFVYGTLAPGRPNEHVLSAIEGTWQPASVTGTLRNEGWAAVLGFPGLTLDPQGTEVEGLLFSSAVLSAHWQLIDEFGGDAYERVPTMVKTNDGAVLDACVYVLRARCTAVCSRIWT